MSNPEDKSITINLDHIKLLAPVMSADILNAFHSALILKKLCGTEISAEVREQTFEEMIALWLNLQSVLIEKLSHHGKEPGENM